MAKDDEKIQNGDTTEPIPREPTQEEYRTFYDSTLEWLKDEEYRPTPYKDAQEDPDKPAELYHIKLDDLESHMVEVLEENPQLRSVFIVPLEIADQHPHDYFLTVTTPYRLKGNPADDPKQVAIHAGYTYSTNKASVSFSIWGTERADGSKFWQGDYTQESGEADFAVEEESRAMTIRDLRALEAVVAYSERCLGAYGKTQFE